MPEKNTNPNAIAIEKFVALVKTDKALSEEVRKAIEKDCVEYPVAFERLRKVLEVSEVSDD